VPPTGWDALQETVTHRASCDLPTCNADVACDELTRPHSDQACYQPVANLLPTCCQPVALPTCCHPAAAPNRATALPEASVGARSTAYVRPSEQTCVRPVARTAGEQWGADAQDAISPLPCATHILWTPRATIELVPPPTSPFCRQWHPADPVIPGIPLHQAIQCRPTPRGSVRGHMHRI